MKKSNTKNIFRNKNLRYGGFQAVLIFIVVAALILINVIVSRLPVSVTQFDTSNTGRFTLSQQTVDQVAALKEDITIYLVAQTGKEDADLVHLLDRYENLSDHIKVVYKDPILYPSFVQKYTATPPSESSLIVESPQRNLVVDYNDIYVYDSLTYYYTGKMEVTFDGEGQITAALDYVTSDHLPVLYVLTGHNESALTQTYQAAISKQNIEMREFNLLTAGTIPQDAACLLLYAPTKDLSAAERDEILRYLDGGGKLILYTDYTPEALPNLAKVMENYGLKTAEGIVIEGDTNRHVRDYAHYLLPIIENHPITEPLVANTSVVLFPLAQGIVPTDAHRSSLKQTPLLTTSDRSYGKVDVPNMTTFEKESGDPAGPFTLGMAVTETVGEQETKVVWYSCGNSMSDEVNQLVAGGNSDLFLNTLSWTCDREQGISIHAKNLTGEKLVLNATQSNVWSLILVIVIPLLVLLIGGVVWYRRRKR